MSDATQAGGNLLVAIHEHTAFVQVIGRGSFKISTRLKQFAAAALASGCQAIVLDMAECRGMDSTFMGVLAGLAFRLKEKSGGELLMVNLSSRTRGLLATLGLDRIIRPYMAGDTPPRIACFLAGGELQAVEAGTKCRRNTAETVLEAHENLADLSPENYLKFKDVLAFLREDLRKENDTNDAPSAE